MLTGKRERKAPKPLYQPPCLNTITVKKDKNLEKKRKLNTCAYESLPIPPKYNHVSDETLLLSGNIAIIQRNNNLFTDFSLLNGYHVYQDVQVVQQKSQKIISVSAERRTDVRFSRWKSTAKRMTKSKEPELRSWGKAVKGFSQRYENAMNTYWSQIKKMTTEADYPENLNSLKAVAGEKKEMLMEKYPCIQLTSHFKGYENRLSKITLNEKLLQLLGYTSDGFASLILREGVPEILPLEKNESAEFLKNILEHCSNMKGRVNISTPEYDCPLLTKCGYIKNVKAEIHIMMNYDEENPGNDMLLVVTDSGSLGTSMKSIMQVNEEFIKGKYIQEECMCNFLMSYYNCSVSMTCLYSNLHKICAIKDLNTL